MKRVSSLTAYCPHIILKAGIFIRYLCWCIQYKMKIFSTLVFLGFFSAFAYAQPSAPKLNKNPYKNSQWYIGLAGGANYTIVNVINDFSILQATAIDDNTTYSKNYTLTKNISATYGIKAMYQFEQRLVLGSGLMLNEIRYNYTQELPGSNRTVVYEHNQHLRYLDVPVYFRFMIRKVNSRMWNRSWRKPGVPAIIPFVQGGINFGFLVNGNKEVNKTIVESGFTVQDANFSEDVGGLLQTTTVGAFVGFGARFKLGNVYIAPQVNLRQGFSNVTNTKTRFSNSNLVQNAYDVFDDKNFTSVEAVISILVPLKYLSKKEFLPIEI